MHICTKGIAQYERNGGTNMKKKLLSLLLVTSMTAGMLAGCGSSGGSDDKSAKGEDENTLTVWAWDQTFNIYAMNEAEKVYQKDHPDFKLNICRDRMG
jgi:Maltose-binding periplasmic proteins/domains